MRKNYLITFKKIQKQPPEEFYKKPILKNLAIFTGKYIVKILRVPILKSICGRLLRKMRSWNWKKLKIVDKEFQLYIKKQDFFNISIKNKWKCLSFCFNFITGFLYLEFGFTNNISLMWWEIQILQTIQLSTRINIY